MNALGLPTGPLNGPDLKALVLDSLSSPITRRGHTVGPGEFIACFTESRAPADSRRRVRLEPLD
jgi:hypothetical protein